MIIEGKPELGLQNHQQKAYKAVKKAYENGNKACVVIPTGCGKSFIALQLMCDNKEKRILFMAPTNAIKSQMYNYIAKYIVGEEPSHNRPARMIADEYFPNLKIMLYQSLLRVKDEQMDKINADVIVMDELHRTGADKWGERINTLLEKNRNAQILGLTATPDRMDDKDVVDELFDGNIACELTLVDALRDGIVKSPDYVKCDYALGEHLEDIREAISNCQDEETRNELQKKYNKMRHIVEQADGIPELFAKNIKKKDGKYIIFCKDKEHMDKLMSQAREWFEAIDSEPEIYSVFSGEGYTNKSNQESIKNFESSKSNHLKLLYSVEMLNEGLHVEDISGVIMARPTDSRIIYLQQLGRALSSDTSRDKTIVFDLVNNYLRNNLDAEVNKRIPQGTRHSDGDNHSEENRDITTELDDIDIFRIQGETQEFLDLLNEVQGIIGRSSYLTNARAIKEWIEKSGGTKPPSQNARNKEEKRLGTAFFTIKRQLIKPYMSLETEQEKDEFRNSHLEIDEVMQIINEIDKNNISIHLIYAREIKRWIEKSGGAKPPLESSKNEEEKKLGRALGRIRKKLIKPYMGLETEQEREEFRNNHPEIDEVMQIVSEIDENNPPKYLLNARAIKEWIEKSGGTKPPSPTSKNEEEKKLGKALNTIKEDYIKRYILLKTEEEREAFKKKFLGIDEVMQIVSEIDKNNISPYLINARAIKEWVEKSGETKPPSPTSKNEDEKKLGGALVRLRCYFIKPYMSLETEEAREAFRNNHPEIDEVLGIISALDMRGGDKKRQELAILIRKDIEKRRALQQAKKLEYDYEQQLLTKRVKKEEKSQEQGVDFDGQ